MIGIQYRLKAAGIHLLASGLIAAIVASLLLFIWYPSPYSEMCGGIKLLYLVISIDLVLGPILTLIIFDQRKQKSELMRDISFICIVQLIGLVYGMHTVYIARPVALVFEQSRFRVVTAVNVATDELSKAPPELQELSNTGPRLISTRNFKNETERRDTVSNALAGADIGMRPSFWQSYALAKEQLLLTSRPVSVLYKKYPDAKPELDRLISAAGHKQDDVRFLPVITRLSDWVVLLDAKTTEPIGFLEKDGFFYSN